MKTTQLHDAYSIPLVIGTSRTTAIPTRSKTPTISSSPGRGRVSICRSASASTAASANRLAESQLRILWEELLPRHPVIEVLAPPRRTYSNLIHGMRSMPVGIPMH